MASRARLQSLSQSPLSNASPDTALPPPAALARTVKDLNAKQGYAHQPEGDDSGDDETEVDAPLDWDGSTAQQDVSRQAFAPQRKSSIALLYRQRNFAVPELEMVAGRKPTSAWQAVAAKVVAATRIRRGLGKVVRIEDFTVRQLDQGQGGDGPGIFGPVSTFHGLFS